MIIGKLSDLYRYKGISKNIDTAIDYVLNNDILALPKGKTIIDGDNVFLNRDTYIAKDLEDCFFENHEKYIDLQIVLKGKELFAYTHITNDTLRIKDEYNQEKDVRKFENDPKGALFFELEDGFALVYTEDVHLAKCKANNELVEKAVIKIKID